MNPHVFPAFSKRSSCFLGVAAILALAVTPAFGAVGDIIHQINPQPPSAGNWCSIGVAFDCNQDVLFFDRCGDPMIYTISPADGSTIGMFNPGISQLPNALAFDLKRNGLWIGAQGCDGTGMPIHFWDFDDNSVTLMFTIPFGLINPATGNPFLSICFTDGLAYNENDPTTDADDEIWFSDDVDDDLALFRPDGTLVAGYDATTVDASLATTSGLAVGGSNLYMANNGGGDVFRAAIPGLILVDQFVSADERQEDMECDPITFAPTEVMWVRTTPQGGMFPDVITAYEIEPGTCGCGGQAPGPDLDIKPGSCPNSFNRNSHGVLPVALVGTNAFDVSNVDISSILLCRADGMGGCVAPHEGPPGPHSVFEDVATPFPGELCDCHELMGDGIMDLSMKFKTDELVPALELGDFAPGALVELTVTGMTVDGAPFTASDCVRLVPPGMPPGLLAVLQPEVPAEMAWVSLSPLDDQLDGGGFGNFDRTFPESTLATLAAADSADGKRFVGWKLDGVFSSADLSFDLTIQGHSQTLEAVYRLPGDIFGDGNVNLTDFAQFANCFGTNGGSAQCAAEFHAASDLNRDGAVDLVDFSIFALYFGN